MAGECPSRILWRQFQDGSLDQGTLNGLASHLETCDACSSVLEQQSAPGGRPLAVRSDSPYLKESNYQRLVERLAEIPLKPEDASHPSSNPGGPDSLPKALGRFEVCGVLGTGGFGRVYLANDPLLRRQVAIKAPRRSSFGTDGDLSSFLTEARHAAALDHPGIVPIYDVIPDDAGRTLIVMKLIEGKSLSAVLRDATPALHDAVRILTQVARAVQFAHERGFVHRDLKPSNVLLDKHGSAHVADFGLGVNLHQNIAEQVPVASGTPPYMSPEQVRGDVTAINPRSDIWALGIMLIELIHGRRPFSHKDRSALLQAILSDDPLIESAPHTRELDDIARRCLKKRPEDRFSTAGELAVELDHWLERQTPPGLQQWLIGRRRNVLISAAAGIIVCVLIVIQLSRSQLDLRNATDRLMTADPQDFSELLDRIRGSSSWFESLVDRPRPKGEEEQFRYDLARQYVGMLNAGEFAKLAETASARHLSLLMKHRGVGDQKLIAELTTRIEGLPERQSVQSPLEIPSNRVEQDRLRARLAVILWMLNKRQPALDALPHDADPTLQSLVIHGLGEQRIDAESVLAEIQSLVGNDDERARGIKFGLLQVLALLPLGDLEAQAEQLIHELWLHDPDSGVHSCAGLTARRHGLSLSEPTLGIHGRWLRDEVAGKPQDMAIAGPTVTYIGTSGNTEGYPLCPLPLHCRQFSRRIAVAVTEITVEQFSTFRRDYNSWHSFLREATPDSAMMALDREVAYQFCNHLSESRGLEPCYELRSNNDGQLSSQPKPDALNLPGYRLLSDAEWEMICRAGTLTDSHFGNVPEFATSYGWIAENQQRHHRSTSGQTTSQGVAACFANPLGVFDLYGNARELCDLSLEPKTEVLMTDDLAAVQPMFPVIRGLGLTDEASRFCRSYCRTQVLATDPTLGLRICRTLAE